SFRERVIGRALRDPDMARRRELEAAAHDRAMEHRHHRHPAELDALEGAMPGSRMRDPGRDVALAQLGKVEPGAELLALAVDDDSFDAIGHCGEQMFYSPDGIVIERVTLVLACQTKDRNGVAPLEPQGGGKLDRQIGR